LKKWHAPGPRATVPIAEVDLRVGGSYSIHMLSPDGKDYNAIGTYREVEPPKRLVYTWSWAGRPIDSVVTVEFLDLGDSTEVVLRHDLPDAERAGHEQGWIASLAQLQAVYEATA
jgi:uncharacterized protein YndB with AHSA1/START domain